MPRSLADESPHTNRKRGGLLSGVAWRLVTHPPFGTRVYEAESGEQKNAPGPASHTDCAGGVASPGATGGPLLEKHPIHSRHY